MSVTADARRLFTERHDTYARFIRAMRYLTGSRSAIQPIATGRAHASKR